MDLVILFVVGVARGAVSAVGRVRHFCLVRHDSRRCIQRIMKYDAVKHGQISDASNKVEPCQSASKFSDGYQALTSASRLATGTSLAKSSRHSSGSISMLRQRQIRIPRDLYFVVGNYIPGFEFLNFVN